MAAPFPGWTFDEARRQYYYYSADEEAYIYQSGERIYINAALTAEPESDAQATRRDPRTVRDPNVNALADSLGEVQLGDYTYDQAGYGTQFIQTGPASEITDPQLAGLGLHARGRLRGAPPINDTLFPDYKKRRDGRSFFATGKVFKALWPELLGQANESVTVTSEAKFNEQIATKIRWFIVVRPGHNHCTCLPIVTYNKQGVAKPGVIKGHHAIAYTSSSEPQPERSEKPAAKGGDPMLPGIRIIPKNRRTKLDKMSRVDFSRMYTVEHNVKVFDFGNVHPSHLGRLQSQWITTITDGGAAGGAQRLDGLQAEEYVGDHDDDVEDDEDDDEPDEEEPRPRNPGHPDPRGGYPPYPPDSRSRRPEGGSSRRQDSGAGHRQDQGGSGRSYRRN